MVKIFLPLRGMIMTAYLLSEDVNAFEVTYSVFSPKEIQKVFLFV